MITVYGLIPCCHWAQEWLIMTSIQRSLHASLSRVTHNVRHTLPRSPTTSWGSRRECSVCWQQTRVHRTVSASSHGLICSHSRHENIGQSKVKVRNILTNCFKCEKEIILALKNELPMTSRASKFYRTLFWTFGRLTSIHLHHRSHLREVSRRCATGLPVKCRSRISPYPKDTQGGVMTTSVMNVQEEPPATPGNQTGGDLASPMPPMPPPPFNTPCG